MPDFVQFPSEYLEAKPGFRLSGAENSVLEVIELLTFGQNCRIASFPNHYVCQKTGLKTSEVSRALKKLLKKNLIVKTTEKTSRFYSIQTNPELWQKEEKLTKLSKKVDKIVKKPRKRKIQTGNAFTSNPPDPRIKTVIDFYFESFKKIHGFPPKINGGCDAGNIKKLLTWLDGKVGIENSLDEMRRLITKFLSLKDRFLESKGYSITMLMNNFNGLRMEKDDYNKVDKFSDAGTWKNGKIEKEDEGENGTVDEELPF